MANPNKSTGTRFETDIERYLIDQGLPAYKVVQRGRLDEGDLHVHDFVLQAKNWRDTTTALRAGTDGAQLQAQHAHKRFGAAVIKRRGKNVREAYVVMPLHRFAALLLHREHPDQDQ